MKFMNKKASMPITVLYDPSISHSQRIIYMILIRFSETKGEGGFSTKDIANAAHLSPRRTISHIVALRDAGLIKIRRQIGDKNIFEIVRPEDVYLEEGNVTAKTLLMLQEAGEITL